MLFHHQDWRLLCAFAAMLVGVAGPARAGCELEPVGTGSVRAVVDGRTLQLTDGREVRLAGIEVPEAAEQSPGAEAARAALQQFVTGEITLKRNGAESDRYGRVVAYVFAAGDTQSAQEALLRQGHARVAARVGDAGCAADLLAAERSARAARLGLWADPSYALRRSERPAEILAERGRFTLVEGRVLSVRESGATIYVNFGRRWSEDFTVTVLRKHERAFTTAGLDLKQLTGRHVRVRGFVEERGGPWIEVARPEQIEIAERR